MQNLRECPNARLRLWIVRCKVREHADAPYPLGLLRTRCEWPRYSRAFEQRDEVTASHSVTSLAVLLPCNLARLIHNEGI